MSGKLEGTRNAIVNHLKPDDLVGALRDAFGDPVEIAGKIYQHDTEVMNALRSIESLRKELAVTIQRRQTRGEEWLELSHLADFLSTYRRRMMRMLEESKP